MAKHPAMLGVNVISSKTDLGKFIRDRRIELNLSQEELAKMSGATQGKISALEIGNSINMKENVLKKMAIALQCDIEELKSRVINKYASKPLTDLGTIICSRRNSLGLSINDLAKQMNTSTYQVKLLEKEEVGIKYSTAKKLSMILNTDIAVFAPFLGGNEVITKSRLGKFIRTKRKQLGLTQQELAEKTGFTKAFISAVERGLYPVVQNNATIQKIASGLNVAPEQLIAVRRNAKKRIKNGDPSTLGGFIRNKRLELDLTQKELAQTSGATNIWISEIERGIRIPDTKLLDDICNILECEIPEHLIP